MVGATSDQIPGREEPRSEGGDLRLRVQPRNIRDPGHGEHVGHLHDQQGGQHVPQTDPGPLWLECSQHCLQHQGKLRIDGIMNDTCIITSWPLL